MRLKLEFNDIAVSCCARAHVRLSLGSSSRLLCICPRFIGLDKMGLHLDEVKFQ